VTSSISLDTSVIAAQDTVYRQLEGEAIVLDLNSGVYFGLNPVGSRIWELLQNAVTVRGVCDQMEREFAVDRAVLERDVVALVGRLLDKGLVELIP